MQNEYILMYGVVRISRPVYDVAQVASILYKVPVDHDTDKSRALSVGVQMKAIEHEYKVLILWMKPIKPSAANSIT